MFLDLFKKPLYKYTIKKKHISATLILNFEKHIFVNTTNMINTST